MNKDFIDYGILVNEAMHMIVRKSLQTLATSKSPGEHHFFISFITKHPGVFISEKLHTKYPYEMTIVLQHQFEELLINENDFSVLLIFDGKQEKIVIPFAALTAFADPSVKFGLQFRHLDEALLNFQRQQALSAIDSTQQTKRSKPTPETKGNVISLDFGKNT
jgi:hypothetical protein